MDVNIIAEYAERIYGYAVRRTYTREEADELSQDILYTAVCEFPRLRDECRFEAWLWGLAANVTRSFRRGKARERMMYVCDIPESVIWVDEDAERAENEALYADLRARIAMLSARYRDILILYYYDGLSTKTISERLGIPEGTVTWRLSEARRRIKEECMNMNETALRPETLHLGIYGGGNYNGDTIPFPHVYIDDALSQNILRRCYEKALTVEELSTLTGVPAYYIEDRIRNLYDRRAILEERRGRWRTDLIIWSDQHGMYSEECAERLLLPVLDELLDALDGIAAEAAELDFYKADRTESDLWYLLGVMAFEYLAYHHNRRTYPAIEPNYDGNRFRYIGNAETGAHPRLMIAFNRSYDHFPDRLHSYTGYWRIPGVSGHRPLMQDTGIRVAVKLLMGEEPEDKEALARAICEGFILRREDGSLSLAVPAFTHAQLDAFYAAVGRHMSPLIERYNDAVDAYVEGYRRLFPSHLSDDIERMCHWSPLNLFATVAAYAQRTGRVAPPSLDCVCDVIVACK